MSRGSGMLRLTAEQYDDRAKRRARHASGQINVPERDILVACIELLRRHPAVAFAYRSNVAAGYLMYPDTYKRLVAAGALRPDECRYMRFGIKGAADITGMLRGGRRLEVECKADRGAVRDDQDVFLQAVSGGGGLGVVVRSVDELVEALG